MTALSRGKASVATATDGSATSPTAVARRTHHHDSAKLESNTRDLLEEYLLSYDAAEACECVRELDSPGWLHRVVVLAVMLSCERGTINERRLVAKLVTQMFKDGLVDTQQLLRAVEELTDDLGQLSMDTPTAPATIGNFIGTMVAQNLLTGADVGGLHMSFVRLASGGASDAVVGLLGHLFDALVEKDPEVGLKQWKEAGLVLSKYEPNIEVRERLLSKCKNGKAVL